MVTWGLTFHVVHSGSRGPDVGRRSRQDGRAGLLCVCGQQMS